MIRVKNKKVIRNLANKSFRAAKTRNLIAVFAIALTTLLFTSIFTMGFGLIESVQRATMVMSGSDGHAVIKYVTDEQYDVVSEHPLIKEIAYSRLLADSVDNDSLIKRRTEFWYHDDSALKMSFNEPTNGYRPRLENEAIADTKTLELLGVPLEIGAPFTLELTVHGKQVIRDFVLAGWWESDPGFNIGQVIAARAYVDNHLDELHNTYYRDNSSTGVISGYIKFASSLNIEENLDTVLRESGFSADESKDNYMATGINWAYMSTGVEMDIGTLVALVCTLLLFVLTGYLIIYNIFQISVLRDIRFYGLLKTIGATGRQLRAIIRRQAMMLSAIGIPVGLLMGFFVGVALVPKLMEQTTYAGSAASVSPNPLIFIGSVMFALVTVLISTRKPGKMAAKVSPIEAVGYTDNDPGTSRSLRTSKKGGKPKLMALANLGRNKKRTVLVILSLSLSIVLANTVFTLSQSMDKEKALEKFSDSDFMIAHADLFNSQYRDDESALSESFIAAVNEQVGFERGGRLYGLWGKYKSEQSRQVMNRQPDGSFFTALYGLDPFPFSRLRLVDGELDAEKLATGNYILEGVTVDDHGRVDTGSFNHKTGDQILLTVGDAVREMTILGHVIVNPNTNTDGSWTGSVFFLPGDIYKELADKAYVMSYAFNATDDQEANMEEFLRHYTDNVEPTMNYKSKFTELASMDNMQKTFVLIGGSLALIIGLIGILNFVNAVLTSIMTRRREFAMLQSIGMTRKQLIHMLCYEGSYYALFTAVSSLALSAGCSLLIVRPLSEQIWFLSYHFVFWPLVVILPLLFLLGLVVPYISYQMTDKRSIVECLRISE